MRLSELEPLQTFELEGVGYECIEVYPSGRIAACFELDAEGKYIPTDNPDNPYKIRLVSDVRFNRQHDLT